jgi:hypothetical protein
MADDQSGQSFLVRRGPAIAIGVGIVTLAAVLTENPAFVVAPVLGAAVFLALFHAPLRWTANGLLFLLLALDVSSDHYGLFHTPLVKLGDFLQDISGATTGLKVAGFEMLAIFSIALWAYRRVVASPIDERGRIPMPGVLRDFLIIYLVAFVFAVVMSVVTSRPVPPWKARYILHIPFLACYFQLAYPSVRSLRPIGVVLVIAAQIKALFAAFMMKVAAVGYGQKIEFATNHGDSILFAMALFVVLIPLFGGLTRKRLVAAALLLPLPIWGIFLNNRRIVWAMVMQGLMLIFFTTPWNKRKRQFVKTLLIMAPAIIAYIAAGWTSTAGVFAPVEKLHSMVDSKDPSTYWRDVETWNIASTIRDQSTFLGMGIGGEYTEYMANDDISGGYADYRAWPHNTVLALMLFFGIFGFVAHWLPFLVTIFFAARSYRFARGPDERMAALLCLGAVACCASMAWGDTGAHFIQHKIMAGLSIAVAGKLAIATGAWPGGKRAAPTTPGPGEPIARSAA